MPVYLLRFHSPFFKAALAGPTCRAAASISATASSAAEMMLDVGAFTTITPFRVAARTSTLSRPTPARAITCSRGAAASASASTLVALRTRMASAPAIAGISSARSAPLQCRISKSGPRASTVAGLSSSAMSTTGLLTGSPWVIGGPVRVASTPAHLLRRRKPCTTLCPLATVPDSVLEIGATNRPAVVEVVRHVGEQRTVVVGVLADQRRLVAAVEVRVAQPRWQGPGSRQLRLGAYGGHPCLTQVDGDRRRAGVGEPPLGPDLAHRERVPAERLLEALPHQHGGVVPPAVVRPGQPPQHLDALHPLLAEPLEVERARGALEVGVRQEGLHATRTTPIATSYVVVARATTTYDVEGAGVGPRGQRVAVPSV